MSASRIFLWMLAACVIGVGVRSFVSVPSIVLLGGGIGAAVSISVGVAHGSRKAIVCGSLLLVFVCGVLRFDLARHKRLVPADAVGKSFVMRGIVADEPALTDRSARIKIRIMSLEGRAPDAGFFVLVTTRVYPRYAPGDELLIRGNIERPENIGAFDYVSYLERQDIGAVVSYPVIDKIGEGKGNQLLFFLSRIRHAFEHRIDAALPEPHAAFMKGLLLGERSFLPPDITDQFAAAGVSHIVALSGYNITLVGRVVTSVLLLFSVPFAVSFWAACGIIVLFIMLTGGAASVVRAGIMGILVLVARKEGRTYHMANALAFAAAVMTLHNPFVLRFDTGFQLSFLATLGLVYLSPLIERSVSKMRWLTTTDMPLARSLRTALVETLSAQLAVLPLLVWVFGRVSYISPLSNILVVAAVPYAMAAGFAAGVLGFVSEYGSTAVGWIAWILLEYQLGIIRFFARMPFASGQIGSWAVFPILLAYGIGAWRIWKKSPGMQK